MGRADKVFVALFLLILWGFVLLVNAIPLI